MRDGAALTSARRSRTIYAGALALLFAIATALMVLIAYMVAELYLSAKGWLIELPGGRELAHLRMRNLLLWIGLPLMSVLGFAVAWFSHAPSQHAPHDTAGADTETDR